MEEVAKPVKQISGVRAVLFLSHQIALWESSHKASATTFCLVIVHRELSCVWSHQHHRGSSEARIYFTCVVFGSESHS